MGGQNSKGEKRSTKKSKDSFQKEETSATESTKFENQLAGHEGSMLKEGKEKLLKLASKAETKFYEEIYPNFENIRKFAPTFYGTQVRDEKTYLVMEDLTIGYEKPSILDIKMGTSSVGEDATPEKKEGMKAKDESTTTVSLGIRISGFKVWRPNEEKFVSKDKAWGKNVKDNTMLNSLALFFSDGGFVRMPLVRAFLKKLLELQQWMEQQTDHRFYSSSLLFVCDGVLEKKGEEPKVNLRMIDFAHVFPIQDGGKDEGYLAGLKNLVKFMNDLMEKEIQIKNEDAPKKKKEKRKSKEQSMSPLQRQAQKQEQDNEDNSSNY